ncbi:PepSY domain-containing protein [Sphingomonas oleivorans]|nr:PepSY domain-containing protein [Sphingomonas oleivorans]
MKRSIMLLGLVSLVAVPALADRGPSKKETGAIAHALIADGYIGWDRIERDGGDWKVTDARDRDGTSYRLRLSRSDYDIVARSRY